LERPCSIAATIPARWVVIDRAGEVDKRRIGTHDRHPDAI
jgi:hypothetical protein